MTYGYTYRTTCLENGKVYVGQKRAVSFHPDYLGSGMLIRRAVKKYGAHRFIVEVLEFAESKPELDRSEQKSIIEHRSLLGRESCYNITPGGEGCGKGVEHPCWGRKVPDKERELHRVLMTGDRNHQFGIPRVGFLNPHYGHKQPESARATIGFKNSTHYGPAHGNFGLKRTAKQRAWMSAIRIGKPNGRKGVPCSEETRRKISEKAKAKFAAGFKVNFTPEARRKISEARKRYWAHKKELQPCV